jgi:hypothetical protein
MAKDKIVQLFSISKNERKMSKEYEILELTK